MDKKRVLVKNRSIILSTETNEYDGMIAKNGEIIVTEKKVTDEKELRRENLLEDLIFILIFLVINQLILRVCGSKIEYLYINKYDFTTEREVIPLCVGIVGAINYLLIQLELLIGLLVMKCYSWSKKSRITVALKMHILMNRKLDYKNFCEEFNSEKFISELKKISILKKDIEVNKYIFISFYLLVIALYYFICSLIFIPLYIIDVSIFTWIVFALFVIVGIVIISLPGTCCEIEKLAKECEIRLCTVKKPYFMHFVLATTVAKKHFDNISKKN